MLNFTQRLILGCVLLAGLVVGLVAVTHKALAAAGQLGLALVFVASAACGDGSNPLFCAAAYSHSWPATRTRSPRATSNTAWSGAAATALA